MSTNDPAAPAVTFTTEAALAVQRMNDRINGIRYWHGPEEGGRAAYTMAQSLASLIAMGGTIYGDRIGDSGLLNLVAHTGHGMTVGMIFFREDIRTTVVRCGGEDAPDVLGESTLADMVESGTWSLHS